MSDRSVQGVDAAMAVILDMLKPGYLEGREPASVAQDEAAELRSLTVPPKI
jgi:hypothetical protein